MENRFSDPALLEERPVETGPTAIESDISPGMWAASASQGRWQMARHLVKLDDALVRAAYLPNQRIICQMPPRSGKLLANSTPILTPEGWVTHGELRPGDEVFGIDGRPTRVLAIGRHSIADWRVGFSDGTSIVCHAEHEWHVYDRAKAMWRLLETQQLTSRNLENGPPSGRGHRYTLQVARAPCLHFSEQEDLPIPPYILGAWLGDGSSTKACLTHAEEDTAVAEEIGKEFPISTVCRHGTTGVLTTYFRGYLHTILKVLGLSGNKHIPDYYRYSSRRQRLELLAGLIDTDGHIDKTGRVHISGINEALIRQAAEVVTTLGWRASISLHPPRMSSSGILGKHVIYKLSFTPDAEIPVVLERKRQGRIPRIRRRYAIVSVERCDPEPGRCIQIDRPDGLYLAGGGLHPTHNSTLCSVYYPAWYRRKFLRRNIMLWSATGRLAQRFSTHVRDLCGLPLDERTHSWEHWKLLGTAPNEGEFYAAGVGGGATMGAGAHLLLIDDYFKDVESALSETKREKLKEWYLTSCLTRMEPNASVVVIATRWHLDDLIGFIEQQARETGEQWEVITMQAINGDGKALWPERWPLPVLKQIRQRYMLSGYPWMWDALYQQEPPAVLDSEWDPAYFKDIWFSEWPLPQHTRFKVVALDPSVGHNEKTDYSAIVLMVVSADGRVYVDADIQRRDAFRQVKDVLQVSAASGALTVGIEINGFQGVLKAMFDQKCREMAYWPMVHGISSQTDKRMKIRASVTPFLSRGLLRFRQGSPGTALLLEQLRGFPSHKYDDGPDALAMAIQLAQHVTSFGIPADDGPVMLEYAGT